MLARLGGNDKPTKDDVAKIVDSVGIKADEAKMDAFFGDLDKLTVSVDEAIASGTEKLAVVGTGGGGGGSDGGTVDNEVTAKTDAVESKDEEKVEEDESSSVGMLFTYFVVYHFGSMR